jgi:hypothetical protein
MGRATMTEADLETLLERAERRLRLERALWAGLAAFSGGVVLASGFIFLLRQFPIGPRTMPGAGLTLVQAALALPVLLAMAAVALVYTRYHPARERVALLLDARAHSSEHLVTWWQLKAAAAKDTGALHQSFRTAQLVATLALASRLDPRRLIPIRLPAWSRAVWLALLLLCSALLMPPRAQADRNLPPRGEGAGGVGLRGGAPGALNSSAQQSPRVQVLKPTELLVFQLTATDPNLPQVAKAAALKELLKKIGNVPESELTPEVRELLTLLRSEAGVKEGNGKPGDQNGNQQHTATGDQKDNPANPLNGGAAQGVNFTERAMATVDQDFSDVKEPLERYYTQKLEVRNPKPEGNDKGKD